MHSYIAIQNTYDVFEIALFIDGNFVDKKRENKYHASKLFIPLLDELLTKNNVKISDFDFCAVNCGPGPFSTLRSVIASVNGLHFATNIPLIGIDGLEAAFLEFYDNKYENTVVLLNAFNNEVYYLIAHHDQILSMGYQKISALKDILLPQFSLCSNRGPHQKELKMGLNERGFNSVNHPINFIGNGVTLHQSLIQEKFGNNAVIKEQNPSMCSIEMIGKLGLEKWLLKQTSPTFVMPLHLKKHAVEL
jgi:tRNA threonylcarbamoyladenosine biosynthesis protein TsaB